MSVTFRAEVKNLDKGWFEGIDGGPEVNLANGNASLVLAALGIDLAPDYCGAIAPVEFDERFERWLVACEQGRAAEFTRTAEDTGGPGTGRCRTITAGMDFAGLSERMNALARVAEFARINDAELGWA